MVNIYRQGGWCLETRSQMDSIQKWCGMVNIYRQGEWYLAIRSQMDSIQKGFGMMNIYRQGGWCLETSPYILGGFNIERVQHSEYIYRQSGWCLVTRSQMDSIQKGCGVVNIYRKGELCQETRHQILDGFYLEWMWNDEYIQIGLMVPRDLTLDPRRILYEKGVAWLIYIDRINSAQRLETRPQILDGFYIERVQHGEYIQLGEWCLETRSWTDSILKGYGVVNIYNRIDGAQRLDPRLVLYRTGMAW